jgi:hypothetical protein
MLTAALGVWLTTLLDWDKNNTEMCRKAYARMTTVTKLKYVGVPTSDLIEIYILYIRSLLDHCSTVWHSTLTVDQIKQIEGVQKLCLKIILGTEYAGCDAALKQCRTVSV